jgi:hypothetical protein
MLVVLATNYTNTYYIRYNLARSRDSTNLPLLEGTITRGILYYR